MNTLKISPRDLVSRWYGDRALDEDAIQDAVVEMMRRGWLPVFVPRRMSGTGRRCSFRSAAATPPSSRYLDGGGGGVVPRGLIESRTQFPIACIGTGLVLSTIGIAIVRVDGNNAFIRATTPGLALMVHSARIHPLEDMPTGQLINIATGKRIPPQHWNDNLRLRVAMTFDELQVDVPGFWMARPNRMFGRDGCSRSRRLPHRRRCSALTSRRFNRPGGCRCSPII